MKIFRGRIFLLLAACCVVVLFGAFSLAEITHTGSTEDPAKGGYSIFHETMVDMTWQEVEQAAKEGAVILTNTAVIEEHGPHMSCGIDSYLGYLQCKLTRRELESMGIKTLIAPPFYWGINGSTHVFPGTFTVRPETMKAVLFDMFSSLKNMGFTNIYNINSHGDGLHQRTAVQAVVKARQDLGINIQYLLSEPDAQRSGIKGEAPPFLLIFKSEPMDLESMEYIDLHAGAWETGAVAAFFPEMVNDKVARKLEPTKVKMAQIGEWVTDTKKVTPLGYLGDPAKYDAKAGKKDIEDTCRNMAEAIAGSLKK
ncbi:creatininase family protein [Acidobacteriota bacterium]